MLRCQPRCSRPHIRKQADGTPSFGGSGPVKNHVFDMGFGYRVDFPVRDASPFSELPAVFIVKTHMFCIDYFRYHQQLVELPLRSVPPPPSTLPTCARHHLPTAKAAEFPTSNTSRTPGRVTFHICRQRPAPSIAASYSSWLMFASAAK